MYSVNSGSDGWINFNLASYTKSQRKASGKGFLKERMCIMDKFIEIRKYIIILIAELILLYAGNKVGENIEGRLRFSDNRINYYFDDICTIFTISIFVIAFIILTIDFLNIFGSKINAAASINENISVYSNKYFIFTAIAVVIGAYVFSTIIGNWDLTIDYYASKLMFWQIIYMGVIFISRYYSNSLFKEINDKKAFIYNMAIYTLFSAAVYVVTALSLRNSAFMEILILKTPFTYTKYIALLSIFLLILVFRFFCNTGEPLSKKSILISFTTIIIMLLLKAVEMLICLFIYRIDSDFIAFFRESIIPIVNILLCTILAIFIAGRLDELNVKYDKIIYYAGTILLCPITFIDVRMIQLYMNVEWY